MTTFSGEQKYLRRKTPSFSSSLLDSIYRSIDEPLGNEEEKRMRRKHEVEYEEEVPSLRRAIMVEKWIEDHGKKNSKTSKHSLRNSNGSNSSDSSCCGTLFSSSDNESSVTRSLQKSSSVHTMQTPKREKKFITTTKSKALRIYSELKKVKQPISPGGRITRLLNSIFSSKTMKKHKENENSCSVTKSRSLKDLSTSSYAASSLSTTCLSKRPGKIDSNGMKRAVKFSAVSVNKVSEDCKKQNVYKDDPRIVSFPVIRNPEKKNYNAVVADVPKYRETFDKADHEDFEDDNASCSSSDLFELDNIGVKVYAEELPVYGTTKLKINKAIANGYAF
ncbi:protein BIG GRAIN 1-like B [Apium graveolens]|uniref:protein BIG GRAIN 1-like B n=1 Tax=Apium graveolens TaxID=4045 RepID=UPI003D79803F